MDEPTSALTLSEVADLFRIVRRLRDDGTAILFISHRLEELFQIADRVTVLRDGTYVDTRSMDGVTQDELIRMMVGRMVTELFPKKEVAAGEVVLRVKNLTRKGLFEDVSFELRKGEILGMAGLVGAGRVGLQEAQDHALAHPGLVGDEEDVAAVDRARAALEAVADVTVNAEFANLGLPLKRH